MRTLTASIVASILLPLVSCFSVAAGLQNVLLFVGWCCFVAFLIVFARLMRWRCPRCREFYFGWTRDTNISRANECQACGLHRYEGASFQ